LERERDGLWPAESRDRARERRAEHRERNERDGLWRAASRDRARERRAEHRERNESVNGPWRAESREPGTRKQPLAGAPRTPKGGATDATIRTGLSA
jgi:hypothetical protein